jgi:putative nucleotidyltransferase with HDIG domain
MTPSVYQALQRWFFDYVREFRDPTGKLPFMMDVKLSHSRRVASDAGELAADIGCPEPDALTARAAGLLHDVGRFEQFQRFGTYNDRDSTDHGALGLEILRRHDALRDCEARDQARLEAAVRLHNAKALPPDTDADLLVHVRLVRDADKLDICDALYQLWKRGEFQRNPALALHANLDGPVTVAALDELANGLVISHENIRSLNDFFLTQLSWMRDLNFAPTYRRVARRGLIRNIAEALPPDARIRRLVDEAEAWVVARQDSA